MKGTVEIQNLKCGSCKATILNKLIIEKGIQHVTVAVEKSIVLFDYDAPDTMDRVEKILTELDYPLVGEQK